MTTSEFRSIGFRFKVEVTKLRLGLEPTLPGDVVRVTARPRTWAAKRLTEGHSIHLYVLADGLEPDEIDVKVGEGLTSAIDEKCWTISTDG